MTNSLTTTQQALFDVLSDGEPHTVEELHACLPDELGSLHNIQPHLCAIRRMIRPSRDIICQFLNHRRYWRIVGLIKPTQAARTPPRLTLIG